MTADEFETWVAQDIGIALTVEEKKVSVEYLDSSGIVSNLDNWYFYMHVYYRSSIWVLEFARDRFGCAAMSSVRSWRRLTSRSACRRENRAKCRERTSSRL